MEFASQPFTAKIFLSSFCRPAGRRRFAYLSPIPNRTSGTRAISMQQHEVQNDLALPSVSFVSVC
ncbi:hypothetical protein B0H12DRAFT_1149133 [Mycena haematopus]|nr:hypothetical protein B0H12DRAFT_1165381 [Mycena haematopus]KAJ7226494.1 hypothetical protein B0H12DRAFT_1149133 [Mycena haematopus]